MKRFVAILSTVLIMTTVVACGNSTVDNISEQGAVSIEDDAIALAAATPTIVEPSVYDGTGDGVVELDERDDAWVLYVKGNSGGRYFGVKGYDANGKSTVLFVNTTEAYEGITLDPSLKTEILEINATGDWHIEQRSALSLDVIKKGDKYKGTGDNVLIVSSYGKTAKISGNKEERYFGVKSYGDKSNLMVNTTDAYDGTVMIKGNPFMIEVTAVGDWEIDL